MPELTTPEKLEFVDLEHRPYEKPGDDLGATHAGNIAVQTFQEYEKYRVTNYDPKWQEHDRLYEGYVTRRTWEGTDKPRSALAVRVVFDHLEAAYPLLTTALFGQEPFWFEVLPDGETSVEEALATQERLSFVLDQQDGGAGTWHLKQAVRSAQHYGIGFAEVGYDTRKQQPFVEWLDPRDVYVSPTTGMDVNTTPAWCRTKLVSVEELERLRGEPGLDLPPTGVLNWMAKNRSLTGGDLTKADSDALRDIQSALQELEPSPSKQKIELLIYQTDDRIIWVLERTWVVYNEANPWGFKTLVATPYWPVLGRLYGQSYGDVLGDEQKLQQNVVNAYLDELALGLNPPRTASHAAMQHPSATLAFRPGAMWRAQRPNEDMQVVFPSGITRDAFSVVELSETRAAKRTGVNALVQQGLPTPSNANRTATGIQAQAGAANNRLITPIECFESCLLVPVLRKLHKIIQQTEGGESRKPGRKADGRIGDVPGAAIAKPVHFKMLAATKAASRERLAPVVPLILQYLYNPQLVEQMKQIGKVPNVEEVNRLVQDATGTARRYEFFRPLSPEEAQAQATPPPETQAQLAAKQLEAQTRTQIATKKNETELQKEGMKAQMAAETQAEEIALKIIEILFASGALKGDDGKKEGRKAA